MLHTRIPESLDEAIRSAASDSGCRSPTWSATSWPTPSRWSRSRPCTCRRGPRPPRRRCARRRGRPDRARAASPPHPPHPPVGRPRPACRPRGRAGLAGGDAQPQRHLRSLQRGDLHRRPLDAVAQHGPDHGGRPHHHRADGVGAPRRARGRRRRGRGRQARVPRLVPGASCRAWTYLTAIADHLERRSAELAELIALEVGMPEDQCAEEQVPVEDFRINAELASTFAFEERSPDALVLREPVGVVAAITPWNYPLGQIAAKVAPAWRQAARRGQAVRGRAAQRVRPGRDHRGGRPSARGVQPGQRRRSDGRRGARVAPGRRHGLFTGSTRAGTRIGALAMQRVARVTLELGGKSPLVVLDDADLWRRSRTASATASPTPARPATR